MTDVILTNSALGVVLAFVLTLWWRERRAHETALENAQASERSAWSKRLEDAQKYIAAQHAIYDATQERSDALAETFLGVVKENTAASVALTATLEELRRDVRRRVGMDSTRVATQGAP